MKALQPTAYDTPSECSRELYPHPYITQKKSKQEKSAGEIRQRQFGQSL